MSDWRSLPSCVSRRYGKTSGLSSPKGIYRLVYQQMSPILRGRTHSLLYVFSSLGVWSLQLSPMSIKAVGAQLGCTVSVSHSGAWKSRAGPHALVVQCVRCTAGHFALKVHPGRGQTLRMWDWLSEGDMYAGGGALGVESVVILESVSFQDCLSVTR